jgi:metal-responsive CopG/Arc/MetJ family transcriptional regulator
MAARYSVVLSDDLNREIDQAANESENNKSDIMRKALQLYLAVREGKKRGKKVGLVDPTTEKLETEFIGL